MIYLIIIFYLLIRIYPYILSPVPLGYDPGLYLYLWQKYSEVGLFQFTHLPRWLIEVYPPLIAIIGKILTIFFSPESFLIPLSFAISISLFVSIYIYSRKKYGVAITNWVMFFLATSIIQYKLWWWYYIKNILAISFIFYYLYFDLIKTKWKYLFVPLVVLTHQPTAIILFLIIFLKGKWKMVLLFLAAFLIYYIPNFSTTISPFLKGVSSTIAVATGTFYDLPQSLLFMAMYLPFVLYGIYISFKSKHGRIMPLMFFSTLLIVVFGLYLSRRYIPFLDIFAVVLAGIGAHRFFAHYSKAKYVYIPLMVIVILLFVYTSSAAEIYVDEFNEIKLLQTTPQDAKILVTDYEYTPWIYGYSKRLTITPGFGENDIYWTKEEWQKYWLSGDANLEIQLLQKLPQPLYIWKGDKNTPTKFSLEGRCFQRFSWHTYMFLCGKQNILMLLAK